MKWPFSESQPGSADRRRGRGQSGFGVLLVSLVLQFVAGCTGDPTTGGIFWDDEKSRQRIAEREQALEDERIKVELTQEQQSQLEFRRAEIAAELEQLRRERIRSEAAMQALRARQAALVNRLAEIEKQLETASGGEHRELEIEREMLERDLEAIVALLWEQ